MFAYFVVVLLLSFRWSKNQHIGTTNLGFSLSLLVRECPLEHS